MSLLSVDMWNISFLGSTLLSWFRLSDEAFGFLLPLAASGQKVQVRSIVLDFIWAESISHSKIGLRCSVVRWTWQTMQVKSTIECILTSSHYVHRSLGQKKVQASWDRSAGFEDHWQCTCQLERQSDGEIPHWVRLNTLRPVGVLKIFAVCWRTNVQFAWVPLCSSGGILKMQIMDEINYKLCKSQRSRSGKTVINKPWQWHLWLIIPLPVPNCTQNLLRVK